jgi:hypothetical protein
VNLLDLDPEEKEYCLIQILVYVETALSNLSSLYVDAKSVSEEWSVGSCACVIVYSKF